MSSRCAFGQPAAQIPIQLPHEGSDHVLYSDFTVYRDAHFNEAVPFHLGRNHELHQFYRIQLR